MIRKLLVLITFGLLILGTAAPVLAERDSDVEPAYESKPKNNRGSDDDCEYRLNAELKKEVEDFVEGLAKKYNLRLFSIETNLFGKVCRINWRMNEK